MTLHLIKLAVGVRDTAHLAEIQSCLVKESLDRGGDGKLVHYTRNFPRRAAEVLDGGALFRVIRGLVQVRQRILAIERGIRRDGTPACALVLDTHFVRTRPKAMRPFQGWRYLDAKDAPPDLGQGSVVEDMPLELAAELEELGLL